MKHQEKIKAIYMSFLRKQPCLPAGRESRLKSAGSRILASARSGMTRTTVLVILISIFSYFIFFGVIFKTNTFFAGSDVDFFYLPSRVYLYESIMKEHRFPFWTEKMYAGFPIYADAENGYLNPLNIISTLLLGPINSYKFLHLFLYLIGSISLYFLLKKQGLGVISYTVTNLIYYFSFPSLDHSIHFNIVMTIFLLPLSLLLVNKFFETKSKIYIFFCALSIVNGVYWGHMQTVLIYIFAVSSYSIFLYFTNIKLVLFFLTFLGIFVIFLSLPQTIPSYLLYKNSERSESIVYTKGSLTTNIASVTIFPFIFGRWENYTARNILREYTYTESYIYLGVSIVISLLFGVLFNKKNRLFYFSFFLIVIFLIFGFIRYVPIFNSQTPVISWFRYWQRVVFISSLGVGIIAGTFIEKFAKVNKKSVIIGTILTLSVIAYLYFLNLYNHQDSFYTGLSKAFNFKDITNTKDFGVWKLILIFSLLLNFLNLILPKNIKKLMYVLQISLCLLFIYDLNFFGTDVIKARTAEISNLIPEKLSETYNSKRILLNNHAINGNQNLLYKPWFITGYSQFLDDRYSKYFSSIGAGNINRNVIDNPSGVNYKALKKSKVTAYVNSEQSNKDLLLKEEPTLDLFDPLKGRYLEKKEGYIKFETDYSNPQYEVVNTGIKNDFGWSVKINNKKITISNKEKLFIPLYVPGGKNIVELKYSPYPLYIGISISLFLNLLIIILLKKLPFPNEKIL